MKKVTALFLAMLMCMALAVPALGTGTGSGDSISSGDGTVKYEAKVQEPTIDVTVPSANQTVILNPYQIKVTNTMSTASGTTIGDSVGSGGSAASQAAILSTKLYLTNKSTVPLKMVLTLKGTPSSTVSFSNAPLANATTEKNKKVFIFADVGTTTTTAPADLSAPALSSVTYSSSNTRQAVFKSGDQKMSEITIQAASDTAPNYTPIQLGGDCTPSPTAAWAREDTVTISLFFSFQADKNTVGSAG